VTLFLPAERVSAPPQFDIDSLAADNLRQG